MIFSRSVFQSLERGPPRPFKKRAVLYEKMLGAASAPSGDVPVTEAWLHLALTNDEPIAY
jgi:hypothetical protein